LRTGDEKYRVLKKRESFKRNRSREENFERERNEKQRDHNQGEVFLDRKRFMGKLSLKPERERIKTEKEGERKLGEYQKRTGEKPPRTVVCHCESATVNHREQKHRHETTAERGEHC